ncbi:sensor histidine kinase [Sphingomonas sp. DT-51]|uniref:sensor histidine kinase n=1 Tax=Sphingomonas sp. DT-51 TaxID=3396165 RepID=UPI003F1D243E
MTRSTRRARSITQPIFALVIASVIAATAILFFVTFSGPPPRMPPRPLEAITAALRGLPPPPLPPEFRRFILRRGGLREWRIEPLVTAASATAPTPRWREKPDPLTQSRIAALLHADPHSVLAFTELSPRGGGRELFGSFTVAWHVPQGWRVVRSPRLPLFTRWHVNTLIAMLVAILALSIPAWMLARAISRPLARLAAAADRAGTGAPLPTLTGGGREVRELAHAVSTMHARLAGHAESRTAMLAAIAHDLGTPLSRLAFWVEQLPEAARDRAVADIDEMRAMIAETLRFARHDVGRREETLVELSSLLDSLAEDMAVGGAAVSVAAGPRAVVSGDPSGLRRLFTNLIDNALRYGDHAEVAWQIAESSVLVTIADRGPGIDPGQAERLFEPFVRGDPSRNRSTGGTGLGLAIVRSIATRHGGTATLANCEDAPGAVATVSLPLAR